MMESAKKNSVGARIIQGLQELVDAVEKKQPLTERFPVRTVKPSLHPSRYSPELVKKTRQGLRASQNVFALLLGVSVKTVRAWEQGTSTPSDIACRFMDEIRLNPKYWIGRLETSAVVK